MNTSFTRYPTILENRIDDVEYNIEIFGEMKLAWGIEFFIYRIKFAREDNVGIGDVKFLPKEEFFKYFNEFTEVLQSDLH